MLKLQEADYFAPDVEMHYARLRSADKVGPQLHAHDFFEIVFVTMGEIEHHVNGRLTILLDGSLTLIRPEDAHYYRPSSGRDCHLINLAVTRRVIDELFAYLGDGFAAEPILTQPLPPTVNLSPLVKAQVRDKLEQLHAIPPRNNAARRTGLRILLFQLITQYFPLVTGPQQSAAPEWLQEACRKMEKPENLAQGLPQMLALANVSPEHLARSMRRYLGQTPTQFINQLRLTYAANLLTHGDMEIVTIAADVGFDSLSYFYTLFKRRFGQTPRQFRRRHQPQFARRSQ
jgi:AraC family cel operon transcriptional repressor